MSHRGPDDRGHFVEPDLCVGLGHVRLSIIDLATGKQPLSSSDDLIVLVCNGEIYDFERIRGNLEALGHRFKSKSDSEAIIHLYEKYGLEFVSHLRGEFAFLLLDRRRRVLYAFRDRFGTKPLYYCATTGGGFVFASEVKGIAATGLVNLEFDPTALKSALTNMHCIPSVFKGIAEVEPGEYLSVNLDTLEVQKTRYWDFQFPRSDSARIFLPNGN